MTSERTSKGLYTFSCDSCPEVEEVEDENVEEAFSQLKSQGWTAFVMNGEWHHECSLCSKEEA